MGERGGKWVVGMRRLQLVVTVMMERRGLIVVGTLMNGNRGVGMVEGK